MTRRALNAKAGLLLRPCRRSRAQSRVEVAVSLPERGGACTLVGPRASLGGSGKGLQSKHAVSRTLRRTHA